jgi:hypothetical protein
MLQLTIVLNGKLFGLLSWLLRVSALIANSPRTAYSTFFIFSFILSNRIAFLRGCDSSTNKQYA